MTDPMPRSPAEHQAVEAMRELLESAIDVRLAISAGVPAEVIIHSLRAMAAQLPTVAFTQAQLADERHQPATAAMWRLAYSPPTALAQLCEALGEPLETPADHPSEPSYRITWEQALDIVRGRTQVWSDLLRRAEEVDGKWLSRYRQTRGGQASQGG